MKNFYVGSQLYYTSLFIEMSSIGFYLGSFYLVKNYCGFGSYSTIFSSAFSSLAALFIYWLYFWNGKKFKKYWTGLKKQKIYKIASEKSTTVLKVSVLSNAMKKEKKSEEKLRLQNWPNFIKFNSIFSFNTFLQSVWWQIDGFTTS